MIFPPVNSSAIQTNADTSLTIYTYDSLLADKYYNWVGAFESYANLPNGSVKVVLFPDAGNILTKAVTEKANPVADVLIGLDNALVHKARTEDILQAYKPKGADNLTSGLVSGLASDYLLTPYDYGLISLWYDKTRLSINESSFVLQDLITQDLAKNLVIENPQLSSTGLGFLLWTIGVYGDKANNIAGLLNSDWRTYWDKLSKDTRIADSWGDALDTFYTPEANRSIMVSYSTSTSYNLCNYNDSTTGTLLSHEGGKVSGWEQIEGLGVVKNAAHQELAKTFVDWFISQEVQSHIYESQWMYPARVGIQQPSCYDKAYSPNTVNSLNTILPQTTVITHLENWLDDWEVHVVQGKQGNGFLDMTGWFIVPLFLIPIIRKTIKRFEK